MSCGRPHDLDCGEALAHLYEYLDGEIDLADAERIRHHLDECSPCLDEFDVERIVKALVARTCSEHAPSQLHARVVTTLVSLRIGATAPEPPAGARPAEPPAG